LEILYPVKESDELLSPLNKMLPSPFSPSFSSNFFFAFFHFTGPVVGFHDCISHEHIRHQIWKVRSHSKFPIPNSKKLKKQKMNPSIISKGHCKQKNERAWQRLVTFNVIHWRYESRQATRFYGEWIKTMKIIHVTCFQNSIYNTRLKISSTTNCSWPLQGFPGHVESRSKVFLNPFEIHASYVFGTESGTLTTTAPTLNI